MDRKPSQNNGRNCFSKLSPGKNRLKGKEKNVEESKQTMHAVIVDESFDTLQITRRRKPQKSNSPIVIDDSCELSTEGEELFKKKPSINEPSKAGNISMNLSKEEIALSPQKSRPGGGGWSPAQNFICATPKHGPMTPSTPKDLVNESLEQCSIEKIQQTQIKLLNDLYGETWKSIPKLFKNNSINQDNFQGITKKLFIDDDDSDKENIKKDLQREKLLYLTGSNSKHKTNNDGVNSDKKSKKKLYTEKIPHTPDLPKTKPKIDKTAKNTKKLKGLSVTELVNIKNNELENLIKNVENVSLTPSKDLCQRISFVASLADNVPSWRCHVEAIKYIDGFKTLKEQLAARLYVEFNKVVFSDLLDKDLPIIWEPKLRMTAGTTINRLIKTANGARIRTSSIKLSTKVVDGPQRLRDTLIHELCHSATWLIDGELRAGHGPLWKKWVTRALKCFPELKEISRCHNMDIQYKYCYRCTDCGYKIQRHTKSIDVTEKCCGYCRGKFEVIVNKKNKDGVIVSTPARKGTPNEFALYVKENYGNLKKGRTHAQVMKLLGEQFSARKKKHIENVSDLDI